jgi:HB1, ASXL, restriction endonuclease HTH domain
MQRPSLSSYLSIAEKVLSAAGSPLSGREIMARAYMTNLVPPHLHGRTQHKTLQARLSEDIRKRSDKSVFCRTAPGVFFLRKFLGNTRGQEFRARPRIRDLHNKPILTLPSSLIHELENSDHTISPTALHDRTVAQNFEYMEYTKAKSVQNAVVWSYVVIFRDDEVLQYRRGRYREQRDEFTNQKTIGFVSLPTESDRNFFSIDNFGLISSGIAAAAADIDLPYTVLGVEEIEARAALEFYACFDDEVVGVVTFKCPDWFEPIGRKLAINDLKWTATRNIPNDMDDFDPWSRELYARIVKLLRDKQGRKKSNDVHHSL